MMDLGTKTIKTERLILRKFTIGDIDGMYNNWATDEETCKLLHWDTHKSKEETKGIINELILNYEKEYNFNWVIQIKETNEIIGNIRVNHLSVNNEICEVGYCYGSKFWGKGYATEALMAVNNFLIKEVGFRLVQACHISGNPNSGIVMTKAGMHFDAVLRERRINKSTKEIEDLVVYSILKEELL